MKALVEIKSDMKTEIREVRENMIMGNDLQVKFDQFSAQMGQEIDARVENELTGVTERVKYLQDREERDQGQVSEAVLKSGQLKQGLVGIVKKACNDLDVKQEVLDALAPEITRLIAQEINLYIFQGPRIKYLYNFKGTLSNITRNI